MTVKFRVFEPNRQFPNPTTPIREYEMEIDSPEQMEQEYQESRRVWAEYQVEARFGPGWCRGENLTYQEQLMDELIREDRQARLDMMVQDMMAESPQWHE